MIDYLRIDGTKRTYAALTTEEIQQALDAIVREGSDGVMCYAVENYDTTSSPVALVIAYAMAHEELSGEAFSFRRGVVAA